MSTYTIQSYIKDRSLSRALGRALANDGRISDAEVKVLLKSTLDGKRVTDQEFRDLKKLLRLSRTLSPDARLLIAAHLKKYYRVLGPFVKSNVDRLEGTKKVFSGQCAGLVQWYTRVGRARNWREGIPVKGNGHLIKKGTAVATFVDGFYPNKAHGNHAALYVGQDSKGIYVMDQCSDNVRKPRVSERHMSFLGKNPDGTFRNPSNNGDALSVIMRKA